MMLINLKLKNENQQKINRAEISYVLQQELVRGFASETVMLLYIQCTYIFNIMSVALLDTPHSGSESLAPLMEIEHGSGV
jgi:hypothetical protein